MNEELDIEPTEELRIAALAAFLEEDSDDISVGYYDKLLDGPGGEWLVCTDEEADQEARENIERDLWAFRPEFVANFTPNGVDAEVIEVLQNAKYEDASEAIRAMIGDRFDDFVDEAICADGRGHFLSGYDGHENEIEVDGIDWFIYRVN